MHEFALEWLSVIRLSDTAEHDNQPIVKGYHGFPSLPKTWLQRIKKWGGGRGA